MLSVAKTLIAVTAVSVAMGVLVGTATANRLAASTQTLTVTWTAVTFTDAFGGTLQCPLTLAGSLHSRTITKVAGALIGFINRASFGVCSSGSATVLQAALPWHVRYLGFSGVLPNITSVRTNVIGAALRFVTSTGVPCLFTSSTVQPLTVTYIRGAGGAVTSKSLGGTMTSNEACAFGFRTTINISGNSSTVTPLTITLI